MTSPRLWTYKNRVWISGPRAKAGKSTAQTTLEHTTVDSETLNVLLFKRTEPRTHSLHKAMKPPLWPLASSREDGCRDRQVGTAVFPLLSLPVEIVLQILSFVDVEAAEALLQFPRIQRLQPNLLETKVKDYRQIAITSDPPRGPGRTYSSALALLKHMRADVGLLHHITALNIPEPLEEAEVWDPGDLRQNPLTMNKVVRNWAFERIFGDDYPLRMDHLDRQIQYLSENGGPAGISAWNTPTARDPLNGFHDRLLLVGNLPKLERLRINVPRGAFWGMLLLQRLSRPVQPLFSHLKILNLLLTLHPVARRKHKAELGEVFKVLAWTSELHCLDTVILDGDGNQLAKRVDGRPPAACAPNIHVRRVELHGCNIASPQLMDVLLFSFPNLLELSIDRLERWPLRADPRSEPQPHWWHPLWTVLPALYDRTIVRRPRESASGTPAPGASAPGSSAPGAPAQGAPAPGASASRDDIIIWCSTYPHALRKLRIRFENATLDTMPPMNAGANRAIRDELVRAMFLDLSALRELDVSAAFFFISGWDQFIKLAESLPRGLEVLKLHNVPDLTMAERLFEGLEHAMEGGFLGLKRVVFSSQCSAASEHILGLCKKLKIDVREVKSQKFHNVGGSSHWM